MHLKILPLLLLLLPVLQTDKPPLLEYEFIEISNIHVNEHGIYVADLGMKRIYRFDRDGNFINHVGRAGRGPGEFNMGPYIMFRVGNRFYVYDRLPNALNIFNMDLELDEVIVDKDIFVPATSGFQYADSLMFLSSIGLIGEPFGKYNLSGELIHPIVVPEKSRLALRERFQGFAIDDLLVLVWKYVNRIDTFSLDGERINSCKIMDLADEVKHEIQTSEHLIPPNVSEEEAEFLRHGIYLPYGELLKNSVTFEDYLLIQYGNRYNEDSVQVVNTNCEVVGEISLERQKTIMTIDTDNLLYYVYRANDYQRVGIKDLEINWFD